MLVLVRYCPATAMAADDMLGAATGAVDSVESAVENAASAIPGVDLFFKEEKEEEKKTDKAYTYFQDYKDWDQYIKKMGDELPDKLKEDENQAFAFDFEESDRSKFPQEAKKLLNDIKSKTADWKDFEAHFHFVGLGPGGNVANECIKELIKEADFNKRWYVKSALSVATPYYKEHHQFDEQKALRGKGRQQAYVNAFDMTQKAIDFFEPNDKLLKLIAESNSNTLSVFTGKIKSQLVATLARLLSIKSFGTGSDNQGNIDKLTQCKDDVSTLITDLKDACLSLFNAFPQLIDPGTLPDFKRLADGFNQIPDQCVQRLERFIDEFKKAREGVGFDSKKVGINKLFNVFCPLVDHVSKMLRVFTYEEKMQDMAMDKIFEKAGLKKILAPARANETVIPVDPYFEKVAETARQPSGSSTEQKALFDQAALMINRASGYLSDVAKEKDLDLANATFQQKQKIFEAVTMMLLPMMPSKKKFYARLLQALPLGGLNDFLSKLTADKAFAPLKKVMGFLGAADFDEGTPEAPGLKTSIQALNKEIDRIKGFLNKNNFPIHKDANSLYFIYNSHNIILKKPYGPILNFIDRQTGYYDVMTGAGYENTFDLNDNRYSGKGGSTEKATPVVMVEEN